MAWNDFYMQTTGSDLNAGSTNSDAAVYTSTGGNWDGTSVFTPTDGSTPSSSVNVNDWCSIYPTGNTTTPYIAQVTAVGAGVNGTITLSTTNKMGSAPASNSGSRNAKTGGAWADLGMLASGVALNTGTVAVSTRINIKAGTYANTTTARAFGLAGAATAPLWYRGYKTTIGDQDSNNLAVAGTDIPSFTFTTALMTIAGACRMSNIDISSASTNGSGAVVCSASGTVLYGVRINNTASNANSTAFQNTGGTIVIERCYFKATSSAYVMKHSVNNVLMMNGTVLTGGAGGILITLSNIQISHCVFDSPSGDAINTTNAQGSIHHCSFYAPTGNGVNVATVSGNGLRVANCYFSTVNQASKAAINNTSGTNTSLVFPVSNAYFNCTSNLSGIQESFAIFDNGTLASEAFKNPGSHDFTILPVGWQLANPGTFETVSLYQGYEDIGAVQHLTTGGPTGQIMRVTGQHYQAN
jgi:hypothetical protein